MSRAYGLVGTDEYLDNAPEHNANTFKLFDDFAAGSTIRDLASIRITVDNHHGPDITIDRLPDADDSGVDMENGNPMEDRHHTLESEVMIDPWSSMESSTSPLTDSTPSAGSEDSTPSASAPAPAAPPRNDKTDPVHSLDNTKKATRSDPRHTAQPHPKCEEKSRRDLTLDLDNLEGEPRRRHFLDEDYRAPTRSNVDTCRIPKPHFLDHSPSPDELEDRSDITNPNFLDEDISDDKESHRRGALPKRPERKGPAENDRPRAHYRSHLHYGLGAAQSSERDKRTSQLYRGTWPGEGWPQDTSSVRSFSSAGSDAPQSRRSADIETKMDCVYSLLSLLSLSPENNADLSSPLLEMSRSVDSCIAMRQAGCIPLLVQLIHSTQPRDTRNRAAQALRNIIHTQTDDKAGRREARVWRLLEQVREYCYILEDSLETSETREEDMSRHPSQCVAALMKLSFDEEHRHVVCQLGGLQTLARLVSADQAAHGSHMEEGTCVTMRKYAGMTLTNLTFGDGNNKSLLCSFKDFMMALVEQLQSPNDDMRQVTSAVLRNLSWRADNNSKQVLREVGAVKGLTQAAMTCQKEATLKSVLSALWNLTAHCSMNKVALCSVEGALGFLVNMLSYNSPTKTLAIVENAGGIMRNVSSHIAVREDYRQVLRERNCLSVLLQHLKSPSLTVVSNSCGTLWNLSARCPQDQQFLWDQGAVPMLRSLIHSKHKMIAMGSSAALKNLLNSKPGKKHIISLDSTARNMNLPVLPTLGARKQKAMEQEIDQNLAETCDNIEPATSPSTTNRDEKNLFSATERQLAMNLERHRMTSSSPLMGHLGSQNSLSHSAHLAGYLSCSNTLLKGTLVSRSVTGSTSSDVNRSDSKDSVTSTHSDTVFEKATRKVPIPTPRTNVVKSDDTAQSEFVKPFRKDVPYMKYPSQPPIPPPRSGTDLTRNNYTDSGYDVDHDSCDQPIDYSRKYSETKSNDPPSRQLLQESTLKPNNKSKDKTKKYSEKENTETFGDYQETDLDQPTDYSLRYAEHQSETSSDISEPVGPSVHEDTIKHFCTEGTPYETPIIFSTATSISDLRVIGGATKKATVTKSNPEAMTQSDEKDTCSIEEPPIHDNDVASAKLKSPPNEEKRQFDTKFSSGMISPEKPVNYCEEGTPGCFSRDSSLSSIDGEFAEETSLAKKNAMATIHIDMDIVDKDASGSAKDKDGSKAVTFACTPEPRAESPGRTQGLVEDTPLVFSRCSSPSSLSGCSIAEPMDDQGSIVSEVSRLTSGCISPSEIPDSPGQSIPQSPRTRARIAHAHAARDHVSPPPSQGAARSVFEERVLQFRVEHTPAHFSTATSLSSLTIDDEPAHLPARPLLEASGESLLDRAEDTNSAGDVTRSHRTTTPPMATPRAAENDAEYTQISKVRPLAMCADSCRQYFTEDTPALLSKVGSNSNLSALSVDTRGDAAETEEQTSTRRLSSDSSNLSDAGENVLNECIQRGIAQAVRSAGHATASAQEQPYAHREQLYRSLPPYLRASSETVSPPRSATALFRRADTPSPERATLLSSDESPPPPLPPKSTSAHPPPRPPAPALHSPPYGSDDERIFQQIVMKGMQTKERKHISHPPARTSDKLVRADSHSSLSLDSYGSTDREIFEECIQLGLQALRSKAHSAERVLDAPTERNRRMHKSLDRDKTSRRNHVRNLQLERISKGKKRADDTPAHSLAQQMRHRDRSNSLSSLSGDSFGSTDKEVFERTVRLGMTKPVERESREREKGRRRRPDWVPRVPGALDKMTGEEDSRDRAILEEMIAKGAGELRTSRSNHALDPQHECISKGKKQEGRAGRTTHSYHGDTPAHSLAQQTRHRDRSNSLSSLSGDSFGSTDKEVFERTVRLGMTKSVERESREREKGRGRRPDWLPRVPGALDKMTGEEDSRDRAILEEMIAKGAGELRTDDKSKNVPAPSVGRAPADGNDAPAHITSTPKSGSDVLDTTTESCDLRPPNELPTVHSTNTTIDSTISIDIDKSNEYPAIPSGDITLESTRDLLDCSNESYADMPDGSLWSDLSNAQSHSNLDKNRSDQNENSLIHLVQTPKNRCNTLPDLLAKSALTTLSFPGPDLTDRLQEERRISPKDDLMRHDTNLLSLGDEPRSLNSSTMIEQEAARLAAKLKSGLYFPSMEGSAQFDLDSVRPPSNMGSLVSLTHSISKEESSKQKSRKKSLPISLMMKRALSNSATYHSSSEHLDSGPVSMLENVKPPSEFEHIDMESSMVSVSSIVSEVADKEPPVLFDLRQPVSGFSFLLSGQIEDLDRVDPPSLLEHMTEPNLEVTEKFESINTEVSSTLNFVTDYATASENCSPLPSDLSSVESTPKRVRNSRYLTPKEKRQISKERYQTYTIADETSNTTDTDVTIYDDFGSNVTLNQSDSKSHESRSARSDQKTRRRLSAKQRRQEDRARYQTQTVDINNILLSPPIQNTSPDHEIEDLKRRFAAKKSLRERRVEDAERFRTRTIEDVPPSPTYVSDVNLENVETTTGYDSLSSNEFNHQQLVDERFKDTELQLDSGTNDDDLELNSTQMLTYTRSFRNYLPVIESPAAVDICVVNNLKNIEKTASYRLNAEQLSDSETEAPVRAKPKIVKPMQVQRDLSLDSTGSCEEEQVAPKAIRGRKKPAYVSPYKRNIPARKSPNRTVPSKSAPVVKSNALKVPTKPRTAPKTRTPMKPTSASKIPNNTAYGKAATPLKANVKPPAAQSTPKPLPIERQGTFTKEESTVLPKETVEKKPSVPTRIARPPTAIKPNVNTSPSRLPQPKMGAIKPLARRSLGAEVKIPIKRPERASFPSMKNSPSNHSLQSNDSGKTVTLASGSGEPPRGAKEAASKIASLWKKVEQNKKQQQNVPDRRVWIGPEETTQPEKESPKLIRSSTFEGQPKQTSPVTSAPKTKSSIAIRVSQVPAPKYGSRAVASRTNEMARKPTAVKTFTRKQIKQEIAT